MPYVHIWSRVKCISWNGNDCFGIVGYFALQQFTSIIFRCICNWISTIGFVMSVCLSVCVSVHSNGTAQLQIDGLSQSLIFQYFFLKSGKKTQVSLKSDKNGGSVTWRPMYIYDNVLLISSYNEKCFRQKL